MKKFTRTYAIIHLDALHANIRQAKERVGDNVKIMAIVKKLPKQLKTRFTDLR